MCCFYICVGNWSSDYYFYEEIENNFFVDCYNLDSFFVNCFVIYYSSCYWFIDNKICCMSCFLIYCFGNVDFDYLINFYSYCLNVSCILRMKL